MIKIEVHSTRAVIRYQEPLTVGLRGAKVRFSFGTPWEGLIKTAVFRQGEKTVAVAYVGDEATIPWEVLMTPGMPVQIGVYGIDSTEQTIIPTVWTETAPVRPGADPEGDPSTEPTVGLWEQMQGKIGSLEQLATDDRSSLVGAVNEVSSRIPHKLSQLENDPGYLTEAPVTSVNGKTGTVNLEIPTKTSELTNDSGFLTAAPVTGVNGQTGDVTLPTVVKVTLKKLSDGQYLPSMSMAKMIEAHDAGNAVYCQYNDVALPLVSASPNACVFTCVHSGKVYTVDVADNFVATVLEVPLASGSGEDGGAFLVTVTDSADGTYATDKTYAELAEAKKEGKTLACHYYDDDVYLPLTMYHGVFMFSAVAESYIYQITISSGAEYVTRVFFEKRDIPQNAVLYTPQALTDEQKAQARENIGAVPTPMSAEIGQTIVVKEVDENGKPIAWGAAVLPSTEWRLAKTISLEQDVRNIAFNVDDISFDELYLIVRATTVDGNGEAINGYSNLRINVANGGIASTQLHFNHSGCVTCVHIAPRGSMLQLRGYVFDATNSAVKQVMGCARSNIVSGVAIYIFPETTYFQSGSTVEVWAR